MAIRRKHKSAKVARKRAGKSGKQVDVKLVPGLSPTGTLPLTAAQEAVLTRLSARIKANPVGSPKPAMPMPLSQDGGAAGNGGVIHANGRDKSVFLPQITHAPTYHLAGSCSTLGSLAELHSVKKAVDNWGILDSNAGGGGEIQPSAVLFPENVYDLAAAVRYIEKKGATARAYGSLFSFSDAVFPLTGPADPVDPPLWYPVPTTTGYSIDTTALKSSLQCLLPGILNDEIKTDRYFFVEAGVKLSSLNTMLDSATPPAAMRTLGGSAGQSLAGAISTGTHGADFDRAPIADCVTALYLIGKGGEHHWVEGSNPVTSPEKLTAILPCLDASHIHYDTDMLNAVRVSFGSMGVIYAALLNILPQYSLVLITRHDTWEKLNDAKNKGGAGSDLSGAKDGTWSGLQGFLDLVYPGQNLKTRACQIVVNPMKNDDGSHKCYVSNRAEIPRPGSGSYGSPPKDLTSLSIDDVMKAVRSDPHCGLGELCTLQGFQELAKNKPLIEQMKLFVWFCEQNGYTWAIRAVVHLLLSAALPPAWKESDPYSQLGFKFEGDVFASDAHNVMANGVFAGEFPVQSFASSEAFFDLPMGISYMKSVLAEFDKAVDDGAYPAGYISLRLCGPTQATLGQERFSPTACIEMGLLASDNSPFFIKRFDQIALMNGGFLHWGQNNGSMLATNVGKTFGSSAIKEWRSVQQQLGGATFTNWFMQRLGLG